MTQLSDAKRECILEAATRMFLSQGYTNVSVDAIAEAAPVSKPTLYNYFESKPALFEAVVARQCDRSLLALERIDASASDLREGLRLIARACVDLIYSPESLRLFRLIIAEQSAFPELGKLAYRSAPAPIIARVAKYLGKFEPSTSLAFEDVDEAARVFIGLLMGDDHVRCLIGLKANLTNRDKDRLVNRAVELYWRVQHGK